MLDYIDIGNGNPILFIHGLGNRKEVWFPQYELSKDYRLIVIELPGHGLSIETEDLTVERYAKDIIELLDYLEIEEISVCGLSLGGLIAQELYKQAKERVKSLILCNTTFHIPLNIGLISLKFSESVINKIGYDEFLIKAVESCIHNNEDKEIAKMAKNSFLLRKDTYLKSVSSAFGRNYYYELNNIKVPTLLIFSSQDKIIPVSNGYIMNFLIEKSKLIIFEGSGHLSNVEKSKEFNQAIINHLNEVFI